MRVLHHQTKIKTDTNITTRYPVISHCYARLLAQNDDKSVKKHLEVLDHEIHHVKRFYKH